MVVPYWGARNDPLLAADFLLSSVSAGPVRGMGLATSKPARPETRHLPQMIYILAFLLSWASAAISPSAHATTMSAVAADPAAIASIKSGKHDCPHCVLVGADLTNQCVKHGNLEGADFDRARLVLMCMSFADFRGASFRGTDLSGANLAHAILIDADLTGAEMAITSVKGTDLTRVKGLTQAQLDQACGDAGTKVPAGMKVRICT